MKKRRVAKQIVGGASRRDKGLKDVEGLEVGIVREDEEAVLDTLLEPGILDDKLGGGDRPHLLVEPGIFNSNLAKLDVLGVIHHVSQVDLEGVYQKTKALKVKGCG